jgi:hypothetical protein
LSLSFPQTYHNPPIRKSTSGAGIFLTKLRRVGYDRHGVSGATPRDKVGVGDFILGLPMRSTPRTGKGGISCPQSGRKGCRAISMN